MILREKNRIVHVSVRGAGNNAESLGFFEEKLKLKRKKYQKPLANSVQVL